MSESCYWLYLVVPYSCTSYLLRPTVFIPQSGILVSNHRLILVLTLTCSVVQRDDFSISLKNAKHILFKQQATQRISSLTHRLLHDRSTFLLFLEFSEFGNFKFMSWTRTEQDKVLCIVTFLQASLRKIIQKQWVVQHQQSLVMQYHTCSIQNNYRRYSRSQLIPPPPSMALFWVPRLKGALIQDQ